MIYFDNSATTSPLPSVIKATAEAMGGFFGNPSSGHGEGLRARARLKEAREAVAASLHVPSEDLYFTSGGTEANNMAILGYCRANAKKSKKKKITINFFFIYNIIYLIYSRGCLIKISTKV